MNLLAEQVNKTRVSLAARWNYISDTEGIPSHSPDIIEQAKILLQFAQENHVTTSNVQTNDTTYITKLLRNNELQCLQFFHFKCLNLKILNNF
jgi:hypothetical protein